MLSLEYNALTGTLPAPIYRGVQDAAGTLSGGPLGILEGRNGSFQGILRLELPEGVLVVTPLNMFCGVMGGFKGNWGLLGVIGATEGVLVVSPLNAFYDLLLSVFGRGVHRPLAFSLI